jgi:hypothetical protein
MTTPTKTRSCTGKRRYPTEEAAQKAVRRFVQHGASPGSIRAYSCRHCGGYHVGHLGRRAR